MEAPIDKDMPFGENLGKAVLLSAMVSAAAFAGTAIARIAAEKYIVWEEKKNRKPIGFIK